MPASVTPLVNAPAPAHPARTFFVGLAALLTLGGIAFAAVLLRGDEPAPVEAAVAG